MTNVWLWPRFRNWVNARKGAPFAIPAADGPGTHYAPPPPQRDPAARAFDLDEKMHRYFPPGAAPRFAQLVKVYDAGSLEFPQLKGITVAQWAIESAWGQSRLARVGCNYAGMKWSPAERAYGGSPGNQTQDGYEKGFRYTFFATYAGFIQAYWARLDRVDAYRGWRDHVTTPEDFIRHIGGPWVGYEKDKYIHTVLDTYHRRVQPLGL